MYFKNLRLTLISLLGVSFYFTNAQNFVADSSFERNSSIPVALSSLGLNGSWSSPTLGTTDLFCECGKKQAEISESNVPNNPMGIQKANSGKCYGGFYL